MEEWGGWPKVPLEILKDCIHIVQINLMDDPSKSSNEIADKLVLPLEDGL